MIRRGLGGDVDAGGGAGIQRTIHYRVRRRDLASCIYRCLGRSKQKPPVLATARLLWLCELVVMPAMPGVSLGVRMTVDHLAPTVRGAVVTVSSVCISRQGHYWNWVVEVCDTHETLAVCTLSFIADIDNQRYQRRLTSKLAERPSCWLCILDVLALAMIIASPLQVIYGWRTSIVVTETVLIGVWLATLTGCFSAVCDWITVRNGGIR